MDIAFFPQFLSCEDMEVISHLWLLWLKFGISPGPTSKRIYVENKASVICPLLQPQGSTKSTACRGMFWAESCPATSSQRGHGLNNVGGWVCRSWHLKGTQRRVLRLLPYPQSHPFPKAPAGMNHSKWPKYLLPPQLPLPLSVLVSF